MSRLENAYDRMRLDPSAKFRSSGARLTKKDSGIERTWKPNKKPRVRIFFRFPLIISLLFFILSLTVVILAYITNFDKSISSNKVLIMIDSPTFVDPGKSTGISLEIENHNPVAITVADIIISHPDGTILPKEGDGLAIKTRSGIKGGIAAKSKYQHSYSPVFYGYKGEKKKTKVRLEYHVEGSRSLFVSESEFEVNISTSSLNISVDLPTKVTSGEVLRPAISVSSNTDRVLRNIILQASYPDNFTVQSSLPKASGSDKNQWYIAEIKPRESKRIRLSGVLSGVRDTETSFNFKAYQEIGAKSNSIDVLTHSQTHTVFITESFIETDIILDGNKGDVFLIPPGKKINGIVTWANDTDNLIEDLVIELQLSGNGLNESEIASNKGFFDGNLGKLVWNKIQSDKLKLVKPGDKGRFQFRLRTLASGHETPLEILNKEINLHLNIKGNVVSDTAVNDVSLNRLSKKQIKVLSDLLVVSKTLYATSNIKNTGPIPPEVGKETTYVLSFLIKNDGNVLEDALVQIPMLQGVNWDGEFEPAREDVVYDADRHQIVWRLGRLGPVGSDSTKQLDIKIRFVPSVLAVGKSAELTKKGILTYTDTFTDRPEERSIEKFTTLITSEGRTRKSGVVIHPEE